MARAFDGDCSAFQPAAADWRLGDWSFGWIPHLERFGQNISEQIGASRNTLSIDIPSHVQVIDQLVEAFGTGGRQNAVLIGQAGVGKTSVTTLSRNEFWTLMRMYRKSSLPPDLHS